MPSLFIEMGFLPVLVSKHDPPNLCLPSSCDYRHEPSHRLVFVTESHCLPGLASHSAPPASASQALGLEAHKHHQVWLGFYFLMLHGASGMRQGFPYCAANCNMNAMFQTMQLPKVIGNEIIPVLWFSLSSKPSPLSLALACKAQTSQPYRPPSLHGWLSRWSWVISCPCGQT
jgi:hypothetical protein